MRPVWFSYPINLLWIFLGFPTSAVETREGQEKLTAANEDRNVGEEEEGDSRHSAAGEAANAEATGHTDGKHREM